MKKVTIASRFDETFASEKCPKCSMINVNFININLDAGLLGCFSCGGVFVSKRFRNNLDVRAMLTEQKEDKRFICSVPGCRRDCGTKLGLMKHEEKCRRENMETNGE